MESGILRIFIKYLIFRVIITKAYTKKNSLFIIVKNN